MVVQPPARLRRAKSPWPPLIMMGPLLEVKITRSRSTFCRNRAEFIALKDGILVAFHPAFSSDDGNFKSQPGVSLMAAANPQDTVIPLNVIIAMCQAVKRAVQEYRTVRCTAAIAYLRIMTSLREVTMRITANIHRNLNGR